MTEPRTFRLYPAERHWWSFADYGAVLDAVVARQARRILEFGPGSSTLALVEGGATWVDTCEDAPDWARVYEDRLQGKYPAIVHVHRYDFVEPLNIPAIDGQRYDLALVDGPLGTDRRPAVVEYCLDRCAAVLVPTEEKNPSLRRALLEIARRRGWAIDIRETGPLSGAFALLTPGPAAADRAGFHVEQSAAAIVKRPRGRPRKVAV